MRSSPPAAASEGDGAPPATPSLSLAAWGVVLAYWPARSPLAFAAAQPTCRIAAEARIAAVDGDPPHESGWAQCEVAAENHVASAHAREVYDAAWTTWARARPFGEWWVSDLAEHVMPTEQGFDGEVHFISESDGVRDTEPAALGISSRLCRPWPPRLRSGSPDGAFSHFTDSAWRSGSPPHGRRRRRTYFDFKQRQHNDQRSYSRSGGASATDSSGVASGAGFTLGRHSCSATGHASRTLALVDAPHLGTRARSTAVKAGYRGGVHAGWLVAFLVPTTPAEAETEAAEHKVVERATADCTYASLRDAAPSPRAAPPVPAQTQERAEDVARVPWRRVVHWEAGAEDDMHRARRRLSHTDATNTAHLNPEAGGGEARVRRALHGDEELMRHRADVQADTSFSTPPHSWHLTHWWLIRPLVARVASAAPPPTGAPVAHVTTSSQPSHTECADAGTSRTSAVLPGAGPSDAAQARRDVPTTSLYAYGCHPAALPCLLKPEGCGAPPHRCCHGVVTAVHLNECRPLPGRGRGSDGGRASLGTLLSQLQEVACCARLSILDVNLEEEVSGEGGGADVCGTAPANAGISLLQGAAALPHAPSAAPTLTAFTSECAEAAVARASRPASAGAPALHEDCGSLNAGDGPSRPPQSENFVEPHCACAQHSLAHAISAQHATAAALWLTEVHLTCSATMCDVNALAALRGVRLIDISANACLTDVGVCELRRSPASLRVLDVSWCPRVDAAAAELVRALPQLEEAYFSGTGVTNSTFRAIAQTLCTPARGISAGVLDEGPQRRRHLRVLHVCACRRLRHPLRILARAGGHVEWQRCGGTADAPGRGHANEERVLTWASLAELRLTAAAPAKGHDGSASEADEEDAAPTADEAYRGEPADARLHGDTTVPPADALARPDTTLNRSATPVAVPLPPPRCSVWSRLTILVITDTRFRGPLSDVGQLSALECLSLLRCSRALAEWPQTAAAAEVDGVGAGSGNLQNSQAFFSGLERCAELHTVHLDGCDVSVFYGGGNRGSSDVSDVRQAAVHEAGDAATVASGAQWLARLPALQNLSLSHAGLRDVDVVAFANTLMREGGAAGAAGHAFRRLCLRACGRLSQLNVLAALASLRALDLSDTAVRQETLNLLGTPLTGGAGGADAAHRGAGDVYARYDEPALQWLSCAACSLIVDLTPLARLRHLRWLDISHTPITTPAVAALRECPALTHLSLKNCGGVRHLREVMAIASLEVLNAQGTGLYDSEEDEEGEVEDDDPPAEVASRGAGGHHGARLPRPRHSSRPHDTRSSSFPAALTPPCDALRPPPLGALLTSPSRDTRLQRSGALGSVCLGRSVSDVFPGEDATLRASRVHTLLLSHTRVCRVRRLGLLPSLMCLELSRTTVSDVELVKFVVTGIRAAAAERASAPTSTSAAAQGLVVYSLRRLLREADPLCGAWGAAMKATNADPQRQRPCGPPLRVLSLQYCRGVFSAGVLGLCPYLVKLDLSASNATGDGLVGLERSTSLAQLRLVACKGVHDLRVLGLLPGLVEVDGSGCNVHTGRIVGAAISHGGAGVFGDAESAGCARVDEATDDAVAAPRGHSSSPVNTTGPAPLIHSDLFSERGLSRDEAAAVGVIAQGAACSTAQPRAASHLPHAATTPWPALQRLALDGCVNVNGFAELRGLPALLELSLCNCPGLTAASVAEVEPCGVADGAHDQTAEERSSSVVDDSTRAKGAAPWAADGAAGEVRSAAQAPSPPFPVLRSLHLSACRHLRGPLTGLTRLPQLQRVHADHCSIASLAEVEPALRSRTVL